MPSINLEEMEKKWKAFWDKEKIYKFHENSKKKTFSIDIPPPTLSGKMHIGHAASFSQQDFIARFKRMRGFEVFYPFGTDDNGLPTERLVEKTKGIKAKEMSRDKFIKICLDFLKEERPKFIQDWKDIGISCDFDLDYSTIDPHSRRISQWSFLDLYKKNRLYRKDAPAMWCPECRTGVSQIEVQDKEIDSTFNDIVFKSGKEDLIIATTRPELLPACVAVFYHPSDKRYKKYNSKKVKVPLFNFEVPVMEDERVDPEKGTGIVMCCTFGDQTDMEWQKAYNLPIKLAITEDGRISEIGGKYKGMKIKEARKKILRDLKDSDLLVKQKPIKHFVNVHERCWTDIEFIKSKQWFVKYLDLKKDMLKWGKELEWLPAFMRYRYENWVRGLQWDWLISNQRYFGVAFPVWYCKKCGEIILAKESDLPVEPIMDKPPVKVCPKCKSSEFTPEKDVLNTWFTSSMTPQIAVGLASEKMKKKLFPMDLRPQAHEIISFWLFTSMVKSRIHYNKNPWKAAMISGFITLKGEKMSKSKGNVVAPPEVIKKYGADGIRYWAASTKLGEDTDYHEKDVITGRKLVNKLLNAMKFVFLNLKYQKKKPKLKEVDRIFLVQLNKLIDSVTESFDKYNYSKVKLEVDSFFWKAFASDYLEIVKDRTYNGSADEKASAFYALYNASFALTKLFAPFIVYATEEVYQNYFRKFEKTKSIHLESWPEKFGVESSKKDDSVWETLSDLLSLIRQKKSEAKKSVKAEIILTISEKDYKILSSVLEDLKVVSRAKEIKKGKFNVEFVE